MKFLLGAILGVITVAGTVLVSNELELFSSTQTDSEIVEVSIVDADDEVQATPLDTIPEAVQEDLLVVDGAADNSNDPTSQVLPEITQDSNHAETSEILNEDIAEEADVIVRQGADMIVEAPSTDRGHFISTSTGEIVTDVEAAAQIIPENINLFIAETAQFRLTAADVEALPNIVNMVVWPDSELIGTGRPYYLLTPPLNAIDSHALSSIVDDQNGYYQKAFEVSKGIFVTDLAILAESSAFTRAIYSQMADKDKSIIMFSGYVDPQMNKIIDETQVDFRRVDYWIDQSHETINVQTQWDQIVGIARHGQELNIFLRSDAEGLADLIVALGN